MLEKDHTKSLIPPPNKPAEYDLASIGSNVSGSWSV